jgi:hypothetical protein
LHKGRGNGNDAEEKKDEFTHDLVCGGSEKLNICTKGIDAKSEAWMYHSTLWE